MDEVLPKTTALKKEGISPKFDEMPLMS